MSPDIILRRMASKAERPCPQGMVYSFLEQEDTKLWHLSALTLFHMFDEEKRMGTITFPEEA